MFWGQVTLFTVWLFVQESLLVEFVFSRLVWWPKHPKKHGEFMLQEQQTAHSAPTEGGNFLNRFPNGSATPAIDARYNESDTDK